jgi:selenide,water dikinase
MVRVVLVGAGHAHVEVLRRWALRPPAGARLTLVVDRDRALYSGMVPGLVAGRYESAEVEIDVPRMARRAGAELILAAAARIDASERRIQVEGVAPVAFDLACLDIGSTVAGSQIPGVREHAIPTRPIAALVDRVEEVLRRARASTDGLRLLVVGAGAGGVELAFSFEARIRRDGGSPPRVLLLEAGDRLLPGAPCGLRARVERAARRRGIAWRCGERVERLDEGCVQLRGGERLRADAVIWVAGAAPHAILRDSDLPVDERGFVRVEPTLQVVGHQELFAVGDCASLPAPGVAKAGVYAVRQGPVLWCNLAARLAGKPLRAYRPQRGFLSLLNLGDGTAIGSKGRVHFEGAWAMSLKDRIDRRFMRRYR